MLTFYMLRSFKRKFFRHISLAWILTCAFLLPLVVSVYRDSLVYGVQLQNYDFHKGQAFHISGAQPEDIALFQDIDGLTDPYYEDGTIYLTYDSKASEKRFREIDEQLALNISLQLNARKSQRNLDILQYDPSQNYMDDPYMQTTLRNMQLINLALLLFSGLIVQAAYRNHIHSFSQELADLSAMGASRGQIVRMFLTELLLLFPLASAGALGITYAVMRLLYDKYLGNMAASAAIWRVFHMDARSTALQIGFYLLVCLGAMGYALSQKPVQPNMGKPQKAASLSRLWMKRTRTPWMSCLAILVPLVTAFLILFNQYLSTYAKTVYSSENAQIIVQTSSGRGFSQETVGSLSEIPGVTRVEPTWDFSEPFILYSREQGSMMVSLHLSDELPADLPKPEKNQFIADFSESLESTGAYSLSRISSQGNSVSVTLLQRIPAESAEQDAIHIYVCRELLEELALTDGYTKLIVHTTAAQASAVEEALRRNLPTETNIFNYQNYVDTTILQQEGNLWLLSWIFGILMVAAMQIVWARLSKYVRDCAPMLRIVQQVGASRSQLSRLIPVRYGAIPGAVLPFAIAIPWAWLDANRNGRPFIVSVPLLGIYLAIAILVILIFWLPVKMTLKKIWK